VQLGVKQEEISHPEGETAQEENQEVWCLKKGVLGCWINISSS
jgi:hypothetical protein